MNNFCLKKKKGEGAGEMAQWLRILPALPEDQSSVPGLHRAPICVSQRKAERRRHVKDPPWRRMQKQVRDQGQLMREEVSEVSCVS